MIKHKYKPKRHFARAIAFVMLWAFLWVFFLGSEITISYNKEKAKKARQGFWQGALKVARYVGDFRRAIWWGGN